MTDPKHFSVSRNDLVRLWASAYELGLRHGEYQRAQLRDHEEECQRVMESRIAVAIASPTPRSET